MKNKLIFVLILTIVSFISCDSDDTISTAQVTIKFTHNWDDEEVGNGDFNSIKFRNANGEILSIERLRYLISRITLTDDDGGTSTFDAYNLVDFTNDQNLSIALPERINTGNYTISFNFGFNNVDNQDGVYPDLNSASWNVPGMLGGGYHFMQFDGKYIGNESFPENFNYHVIRAVNRTDPDNLIFQDTFFTVNLGSINITKDATVEVKMNIAEWFKNPNTWDLNVLNTVLMPNFDAQILMNENGQNVFSLGNVTN